MPIHMASGSPEVVKKCANNLWVELSRRKGDVATEAMRKVECLVEELGIGRQNPGGVNSYYTLRRNFLATFGEIPRPSR